MHLCEVDTQWLIYFLSFVVFRFLSLFLFIFTETVRIKLYYSIALLFFNVDYTKTRNGLT